MSIRDRTDGFFNGILFAWFLYAFMQDYLGRDRYIALVVNNWFEMNPLWWAIAMLLLLYTERKEQP